MNLHPNAINELTNAINSLLTQYPDLIQDEVLRHDMIEAETNANDIIEHLLTEIREAEVMSEAIELRLRELKTRQQRFERRREALRKLVLRVMETAGLPKMELAEATLSVRHIPPAPFIVNEGEVPDNLCITTLI